jgi:hypothetical protein
VTKHELIIQNAAMKSALIRMLWRSVADGSECTCAEPADECPECEALTALNLGTWLGAEDTAAKLELVS